MKYLDRRPRKTAYIGLRLEEGVAAQLRALAKRLRVPVSRVVEAAIRAAVEKRG